jgi:predicted PurR-regulated permease PerM
MEQFTFSKYSRFIVIGLILLLLYISYKIVAPFIVPLLGAAVVAVAAYPLYKKFYKKTNKKSISSILVIFLIFILIIIPLIFFANRLLDETINVYNSANALELTEFSEKLNNLTGLNINFERHMKESLQEVSNLFIISSANLLETLIRGFLNFFIFFFTLFFFLKDGKRFIKKLRKFLPIKENIEKKLFKEINGVIRGLLSGILIVAILEGIVAFIGFHIFNIPNPLIWSFVILLAAYFPIVGPATVYIPAAIYLAIMGNITGAILLLVYSFGLISYLDNIVKPQMMGKSSNINPMIILLGVLGGINFMGIPGIIVGPLILSILFVIYRIYEEENATDS